MLLFKKRFHAGLVSGEIRLTLRRWERSHVRAGGRYRCHPIGVLEVERVERVRVEEITETDARLSGFGSRDELIEHLGSAKDAPLGPDETLFRIALRYGGDGDRVASALDASMSKAEIAKIRATLARWDASRPWTRKTLKLIDDNPRVAASKLAARVRRETPSFKRDVRKLKKLGLTQSFEVGYEISPRGRAYLDATKRGSSRRASP